MPPESVVDECAPNREDAVADAAADAQEPAPGEHQGRAQGQCWRGRPAHPRVQRLVREAARPRSLSPPWPTSRQRAHSCRPEEDPVGKRDVLFNNRYGVVVPPGIVDYIMKYVKPAARYDREGNLYLAEMTVSDFIRPGHQS